MYQAKNKLNICFGAPTERPVLDSPCTFKEMRAKTILQNSRAAAKCAVTGDIGSYVVGIYKGEWQKTCFISCLDVPLKFVFLIMRKCQLKLMNTFYFINYIWMDNAIYMFSASNSDFLLEDMVVYRYPLWDVWIRLYQLHESHIFWFLSLEHLLDQREQLVLSQLGLF